MKCWVITILSICHPSDPDSPLRSSFDPVIPRFIIPLSVNRILIGVSAFYSRAFSSRRDAYFFSILILIVKCIDLWNSSQRFSLMSLIPFSRYALLLTRGCVLLTPFLLFDECIRVATGTISLSLATLSHQHLRFPLPLILNRPSTLAWLFSKASLAFSVSHLVYCDLSAFFFRLNPPNIHSLQWNETCDSDSRQEWSEERKERGKRWIHWEGREQRTGEEWRSQRYCICVD